VAAAHPDIAKKGVMLRKFGQEVIRVTAGKRVHGTGSVPGGMNKHVSAPTARCCNATCSRCSAWAQDAVDIAKAAARAEPGAVRHFGSFRSNMLSLVRADGALDLYDGVIRARDAEGRSSSTAPATRATST
jgi:NAD-reducing hydrogenase large subunit